MSDEKRGYLVSQEGVVKIPVPNSELGYIAYHNEIDKMTYVYKKSFEDGDVYIYTMTYRQETDKFMQWLKDAQAADGASAPGPVAQSEEAADLKPAQ